MKPLTPLPGRSRRAAMTAVVAAAALTIAACGGDDGTESSSSGAGFSTVSDGVLTVAPYGSSPPAIVVEEDGTLGGLLGELLTRFAEENGLEIELFETTFTSALLATQQGRADVTPFIYHTEERAKTVYYTSSIFQLPAAVMTRDDFDYQGPEDLDGVNTSVVVGQVWAPYMVDALGDNAKQFESAPDAAQALINGQVDAYVNSALQMFNSPLAGRDDIEAHLASVGDFDMPENVITNIAYNVVSCENPELAEAMDEFLVGLFESGEWAQINDELGFSEEFRISEPVAPAQGC